VAADGPSAPRLPQTHPSLLVSHDRLEEGVTGPSWGWAMSCAAGAVRTSCSWGILKLMHASINAGGCMHRSGQQAPAQQPSTVNSMRSPLFLVRGFVQGFNSAPLSVIGLVEIEPNHVHKPFFRSVVGGFP
jgi:hypothetical protein